MFAAHVGVALAIGRVERRVNVGVFMLAALLLDLVLWCLVLLGVESVVIPADFARSHQPAFVFPYSHGLLASLAWSALTGAAALPATRRLGAARWRAAVLLAGAVFSHWLLDVLVHVAELPLAGAASMKLGLGWWQNMPLALAVEAAITLAGLGLFLSGAGLARGRKLGLTALCLLVLVFTLAGMTVAPAPPSALAMAASSLFSIVALCALAAWLGRLAK